MAALDRAFGRIFAVLVALVVLEFWFGARTLSGQRPGSVAANLLLSLVLLGQAAWALRRPLTQRDLDAMAVATGALLLVSRFLAAPGSPFLDQAAYLLVGPAAIAWPALSRRFVVPVPILLVVIATGTWHPSGQLAVEQAVATLATVAFAGFAARLIRAGARRADAEADVLARQLAAQDAALATEEAERRAANAVHDDVLSVLRALSVPGQALPWRVLVAKAERAQAALARQVPGGSRGFGGLGPALRRQAGQIATDLDVTCDLDGDLDVPPPVAEALSAAAGEALRNVAAHAGVRAAAISASADGSGGVSVTVRDSGTGFDPAHVAAASSGLRNSVRARVLDVGGRAEVISAPGRGTAVVLTWSPPPAAAAAAVDLFAWARRLAPPPSLVFLGFMAPVLASSLIDLCLRWPDLRWPAAGVAAFAGLLVLAVECARSISRVHMTRLAAVGMTAGVTVLAAVGSLAVAPGAADGFAFWVSGESAIVVAVVYFLRGPGFGLTALVLDLAAVGAGVLVTGGGLPRGAWVPILASPVLGTGLAVGMRAAFRGLASYTERQLEEYREGVRRQARAEAVSRADSAALENARRVAGPVLSRVTSGEPPSAPVRMAAALASATLRDELLAPGFLTGDLAGLVRAARACGALVTVDIARRGSAALMDTARRLLTAALAPAGAVADATLHVYPVTEGHPALLLLHLHWRETADHAALHAFARECGAQASDLGDRESLVRLQAAPRELAGATRFNARPPEMN
jgi:signal transduction histidine kinase